MSSTEDREMTATTAEWKSIDSAPWDKWVMVKNANGTKFLASFRLMPAFSVRAWYDTEYLLRDPKEWLDEGGEMTATEPRKFGDGFSEITPPHELPDADFLTWMASYAEEHQPTGYPCVQTWEITRLVEMHRRLRISQLRRMSSNDAIDALWGRYSAWRKSHGQSLRNWERLERFQAACRAEIERLRRL